MRRCLWVDGKSKRYQEYHDHEWGIPVYDDRKLFEKLTLEIFQSGLSWLTILNKQEAFDKAFDHYDLHKIASYDDQTITTLMNNPNIVRNYKKIEATIQNAQVCLNIQKEWGSFSNYIWHFTNYKVIVEYHPYETTSKLSKTIADDLKKRGMKGAGSITIYSYLEAIGVYNHHEEGCFLHKKIVP